MEMEKVLFESEDNTLLWFEDFLNTTSGSFKTSVELFRNYYHKCVEDLVHLQFNPEKQRLDYVDLDGGENSLDFECNYISQQDIDQCKNNRYHTNILEVLKSNSSLAEEAIHLGLIDSNTMDIILSLSDDRIRHITTEELYLLLNNSNYLQMSEEERNVFIQRTSLTKEDENKVILPFLKIHRLNNLQIKYAHTARVVYLTNYELDSLGVDSSIARNIALTSALFHDVGRFYQGAFYNHFGDKLMQDVEGAKGHAEAGYYYSLLDMISLNTLGVNESEDLIVHAIASLVVHNHQKANAKNKEFDKAQSDLSFSKELDGKLLNFILDAYLQAKPFEGGVHARFGNSIPHQQKYMKQALDAIVGMMKNVMQQYIQDDQELEQVISNLGEFLVGSMDSIFFLTPEEIEILEKNNPPSHIPIIKRDEGIIRTPELNQWLNEQKRYLFCENNHLDYAHFESLLSRAQFDLAKFAQFDIVEAIHQLFQKENVVDNEIQKLIDFSLNVVMDADKLDILIQRVNKRWDNWNPKRIKIFSSKGESFIDALENVFKIPIERDQNGKVVFNEQLKRIVLENMQGNVVFAKKIKNIIDFSKEYSSLEIDSLMEFLEGDYSKLMITNRFGTDSNGNMIYTSSLIDKIMDMKRKNLAFHKAIESFLITKDSVGQIIPKEVLSYLQEYSIPLQNFDNNTITVSYEEMKNAHPDDVIRTQIERDILLPPDLREKVFLLDKDRGENKFPNGHKASGDPHFNWFNIFPAIWWHIDQFILTNMRSGKSFQFLKDSNLLERLRETYKSAECPKEFSEFLDEIIDYGKMFIDVATHTSLKDGVLQFDQEESSIELMDEEYMIEIRDEVCRRWNEKKKKMELDSILSSEQSIYEEKYKEL